MSPMKAQKMLFFTNGWHLATTGNPAIEDAFEAWTYGPVVEVIYHDLKRYGSSPITEYIKDIPSGKPFVVSPTCTDLVDSIDIAWAKYIGIPPVNLSAMTHEPGSPWDLARRSGKSVISNEAIRDYFVRLARR